jgi:hypothetical protein
VHVCDPEVVAGRFRDGEHEYRWALFYLGCDTLDCTHNQVGVAFADSPDGPWMKWTGNPIVAYPRDRCWGAGQPSAFSLDRAGRLLLLYTRGDPRGTGVRCCEVDLSDLRSPRIGAERALPVEGLTERNGTRPWLNNASFAYDPRGERIYLVRDRHPHEKETPAYIASEVQVVAIAAPVLLGDTPGKGAWQVLANLGPADSGVPRNHNAGILRDAYGRLPDAARIEVAFSVSRLGSDSLWSYRIQAATLASTPAAPCWCIHSRSQRSWSPLRVASSALVTGSPSASVR